MEYFYVLKEQEDISLYHSTCKDLQLYLASDFEINDGGDPFDGSPECEFSNGENKIKVFNDRKIHIVGIISDIELPQYYDYIRIDGQITPKVKWLTFEETLKLDVDALIEYYFDVRNKRMLCFFCNEKDHSLVVKLDLKITDEIYAIEKKYGEFKDMPKELQNRYIFLRSHIMYYE